VVKVVAFKKDDVLFLYNIRSSISSRQLTKRDEEKVMMEIIKQPWRISGDGYISTYMVYSNC
jgi:hypothetical protein